MLFPYTYVPHQMENMQSFIDFIFFEVWCQAPKTGPYSLALYSPYHDLAEVMTAFHYDDSQGADFFSGHTERIYNLFSTLTTVQIYELKRWYCANNDIESICANNPAVSVIRYSDFPVKLNGVKEELANFFKKLYSNLDIAALKAKIGNIDDHYNAFVQANKQGKCPFCGINDLLGEYHSKREAYDHYLPKAIYPFNSINFKNLVPACHHCNSSYKTTKNPAYTPKDPTKSTYRRAFFYPYTTEPHSIELKIELHKIDIANLEPADMTLKYGPSINNEKIETWKDVYAIDERYKAKLCAENDGFYWYTQVMDEWKEDGREPAQFLSTLTRQTQQKPYAECNFLKKPFLDACQQLGIFSEHPKQN